MAGQKEFELLFKLKASLGSGFQNTFKSAIDTNKKLQESLKNINSLQSKIDGYTKQASAIDKNKAKLQQLTEEHDKLQRELNETQEPSEALRKKLERNENQIRQTNARIEEQTKGLDRLGQELREAGINTDNLEGSNARLQKSYEKLKTSQDQLNKINAKQAEIKQSISSTKTQLLGTVGAISAVAAALYAGPVQAAQKYETAMAKVGTIADVKELPLNEMSSQIMKLSNTTGIAATAIAEDVYNAISAGQKTGDAVNFVTNSTKLAKAGFAESAQTLDVLTTILNAYGMEAGQVGSVSDMLIQIQNKGKVTVGELSSVMGKIIPTANANNVALEQLGAGYAIMTSKGIAAAETTTYMNSMLNELGKSGTSADKLLRSTTGKSFGELMASGKSLGDVLGILQNEATNSGKSLSDMFGSAEAGKAAISLLSGGVDGFNNSVQSMIDSAGATEKAFAKMENTTEAKMAKAKNSISNLGIVLGQTLLPIVGNLADKVAVVTTKISEFAQANPKLVSTITKVAAGLAALKVGMLGTKMVALSAQSGILSMAKNLLGLKIGFMSGATTGAKFASLLGPIGGMAGKLLPIIGVVTAIITVFQLVTKHLEEIRGFIQKTFGNEALAVFDKVVAAVTSIGDTIKGVFSGGNIGAARDKIQEIFGEKGAAVFDKFAGVFGKVTAAAGEFAGFIQKHIVPVAEQILSLIVTSVIPGIMGAIRTTATVIKSIIQSIAGFIAGVIPVIGNFIAGLMPVISSVIEFVKTYVLPVVQDIFSFIVGTVLPMIANGIQAILPVVQNIISTVLPAIQTAMTEIWNIVNPIIQGILAAIQFAMPAIQSIVQIVINNITGVIQGLMTVLSGIITFITGVFTGDWSQAWEGVKTIFSGIWEGIKTVCTGVINGIITGVNTVIRGLNKLQVPDWVPGIGGEGINIAEIPMLAKGSNHTPDTFIAGEKGPELITNAPGRTVYTANQTKAIMGSQNAAITKFRDSSGIVNNYTTKQVREAPEMVKTAGQSENTQITITNNPTIIINGDKPEDLEIKLEENNRRLLQQIENLLSKRSEDERRARYA